jgi:hypothetical protein
MRRLVPLSVFGLLAVSLAIVSATPAPSQEPKSASRTFVKVYSLADLVAPIRVAPGEPNRSSLAEWSTVLQADAEKKLERLRQVLALTTAEWAATEGGLIHPYPEKLSLVIRQTEAGHQAIEELLRQLRAEDDFEIELQIVVAELSGPSEDATIKVLHSSGGSMTAEQAAELRKSLPGEQLTQSVRVGNGRTTVGGPILNMPRFTAVAAHDRTNVTLRLDNITDDLDQQGKFPWTSQTQTIPSGNTAAMLVRGDGDVKAFLVTPRIVPRQGK